MTNRTALSAVLAAVLAVPAAAGLAQTPCDLLMAVTPALCQPCPGLPVPGVRIAGVGLDYVDNSHAQCKCYKCGVGKDFGKDTCNGNTTCLPGWERFQDGGVWKCRQPVVDQVRDNCYRALPLTITELHDDRDLPFPTLYPGVQYLFIRGQGAANATSGAMTGGIGVTVGEAARRLGSRSACLPPDCQDVKLNVPSSAAGPGFGTSQTLKLYTPHRYRTATMTLSVRFPPTPTPIPVFVQQHPPVIGSNISSGVPAGPTPTPTRTPTPQPARGQVYYATLTCPGTETSYGRTIQTNSPSFPFEIRSAQVQATAFAHWKNTTTPRGEPVCTWPEAYAFKIKRLDVQGGDVTVPWTPNPGVNMDGTKTISLPKGRWQIVPDESFPYDFDYTISFRD